MTNSSASSLEDYVFQLALFQGLGHEDLKRVATMATFCQFASGEQLLEENGASVEVFAILQGRVDIELMMPGKKEVETIATLNGGDIVGEAAILGKIRRNAGATAREKVSALRWEGRALMKFIDDNPRAGCTVMRNLARVLQERLTATNMMLRNTINRVVDIC